MAEVKVVKTSVALPPSYKRKLKAGAEKLRISQSELIRRAIDDYLAKLGLPVVIAEESKSEKEREQVQASP